LKSLHTFVLVVFEQQFNPAFAITANRYVHNISGPRLKKIWRIVTLKLPLRLIGQLMEKIREIIAYKNYFEDFLKEQPIKVQNKIFKILEAIETLERIRTNYLKLIVGTSGLYEARIQLGSDIWRVFCFFDKGKLIILLNGFQKKTQKTPKNEIEKAINLMKEYYENRK
jgi:phage-related protein